MHARRRVLTSFSSSRADLGARLTPKRHVAISVIGGH